ncbi:MAG: Phosphoglycerol transferase I [Chlamydiia bacterium]|nr:Phosphoglycerol transferase I [Chlamydiia bacterium]
MPLSSLKMIRHLPSLKDSLNEQLPLVSLPFIILGAIFYTFLLSPSPIWSLMTLPLLFLFNKKWLPYPFYLVASLFKRKKRGSFCKIPTPENEIFHRTDNKFPLEKYTMGFSGEKAFTLEVGEKTDVVFLYLESFRGHDVGKCTPIFDQLKEKGIYFPHFYANGTQTFKAMFATMYGIPPCFGRDFTESSSTVGALPVKGLADFFAENGYNNVFLKAGSLQFENQGDFLQNHGYEFLYDEKDIKASNPNAYGTSWGVHDEFMYDFLVEKIASSKEPLFISAASVTNHHPFILPQGFTAKYGDTPFTKTMEYSDLALGKCIKKLTALNRPMHVYIMGDHGYPLDHDGKPILATSLKKEVTHVPLLILPLHMGKALPQRVESVSSQIDILPMMMDIYNFKGINSSIGSSLYRKKKAPCAYLLNEAVVPVSGMVTPAEYKTVNEYLPLYETLNTLYKEKRISSSKEDLKILNFDGISITNNDLQAILDRNSHLETLILSNSPLLHSLDFKYPKTLKKIVLDNNILISDDDILFLPKSIDHISLGGCRNLTDQTLSYLPSLSIKEISFSCKNFGEKALTTFLQKVLLKKVWVTDSDLIDNRFFLSFAKHDLEEITISGTRNFSDAFIKAIASPELKIFMCDNCVDITDLSLSYLKNTSLEVLHLEKGENLTDQGIEYISPLRLHTFYISKSKHLTEDGAKKLNNSFMQNLFCIDCIQLPLVYKEPPGKQVFFLKAGDTTVSF